MGRGLVGVIWGLWRERRRGEREAALSLPFIVEQVRSTTDTWFLVTGNCTEITFHKFLLTCWNNHCKTMLFQNSTTGKLLKEICCGPDTQQNQGRQWKFIPIPSYKILRSLHRLLYSVLPVLNSPIWMRRKQLKQIHFHAEVRELWYILCVHVKVSLIKRNM